MEFIVSDRVQVNPDNSWAMSALTFLLFKLNTLQKNGQTFSQPKTWCIESRVLNLLHGYYNTIMTSLRLFVTTQCHVVQINQSENLNLYSVWKLNNSKG